jgi:hypothetical protein
MLAGRINLLVAPCVSPWAYERIQRWNAHAVDPNRSFREPARRRSRGADAAWSRRCAAASCCTSTCTRPPTATSPSSARRWPRATARRSSRHDPGRLLPGRRQRQPAARVPAARSSPRCAGDPHRAGRCAGPHHRLAGGRARRDRLPAGRAGPVRRHQRRALHHHHRGLSRQPARHARRSATRRRWRRCEGAGAGMPCPGGPTVGRAIQPAVVLHPHHIGLRHTLHHAVGVLGVGVLFDVGGQVVGLHAVGGQHPRLATIRALPDTTTGHGHGDVPGITWSTSTE